MKKKLTIAEIMCEFEHPCLKTRIGSVVKESIRSVKFFFIRMSNKITFLIKAYCVPKSIRRRWDSYLLMKNLRG